MVTREPPRPTYRQNWPAYNLAQTREKREFQALLYDLCQTVPAIKRGRGRPSLPLSDMLFATTYKVYSTFSQRRFITDLNDAVEAGFITKVPHYNSISNYLENSALTPIITGMIRTASHPLRDVEQDFAVDSTGFTGKSYTRWFDQKYRGMREPIWVKAHIMCGDKTNIVTAAIIKGRDASDVVQLRPLLELTAAHFGIREVAADKAYGVVYNHQAIADIGAQAFIPFKSNHTGASGGAWKKAYNFYKHHRDEFNLHYHKRSNVEATMSMIKAKFGGYVRSKTETAMTNEVLCKILCHNICCLVSSIYELGIVPEFFAEAPRDLPE